MPDSAGPRWRVVVVQPRSTATETAAVGSDRSGMAADLHAGLYLTALPGLDRSRVRVPSAPPATRSPRLERLPEYPV